MVRRRCEDPFRQPGTSAALRFISSRWADSRHLQWPGRIGHKDRSGRSLRCHCRASGSSARPRKWASATSASYQSLAPWRWCATAHGRKNTMGWLDRMLGRRPRLVVAIALENKVPRSIWAMLTRTGLSRPGSGSDLNVDFRCAGVPSICSALQDYPGQRAERI